MKHFADLLLSREPRSEIVMGNTALVRAFVEAGTRVVTSYPGSPTPEIADAIAAIPPDRRPFRFEFSVNEKVATEVAFGAAMNGHLATVFFKSVGLNVAADTFVQLGLQDILGGMVVVLGDDPGANSSQNEQDNRHLCRMAYLPVWEPADPADVYRMYLEAAAEARRRRMAVVLRLTTHVCHQKRRVAFGAWDAPPLDPTPRFAGHRPHPARRLGGADEAPGPRAAGRARGARRSFALQPVGRQPQPPAGHPDRRAALPRRARRARGVRRATGHPEARRW